jgi:hypothetical protein
MGLPLLSRKVAKESSGKYRIFYTENRVNTKDMLLLKQAFYVNVLETS